ncbi:MAG: hypothetical protein RIR41_2541 [Pseudomonadota bacterium]|jgi:ketosteroid isomerase-like protein
MSRIHTLAMPIVVGAALAFAQPAAARPSESERVKAEIMTKLHAVEERLARGDTATQIAEFLYADDVLLTGEGEATARRGMADAIAGVQGWLDALGPNGAKGCKYSIPDPVVASAKTFGSFVVLKCKANPPVLPEDMNLRMTYVWQKYRDGWRVRVELYALGNM